MPQIPAWEHVLWGVTKSPHQPQSRLRLGISTKGLCLCSDLAVGLLEFCCVPLKLS